MAVCQFDYSLTIQCLFQAYSLEDFLKENFRNVVVSSIFIRNNYVVQYSILMYTRTILFIFLKFQSKLFLITNTLSASGTQ